MDVPRAGGDTQPTTEAPDKGPEKKAHASRTPAIIVAVVAAVIVALSVFYLLRREPLLVQGEADATRFDIAARVDGRVREIPVERGQNVAANAVLLRIDNPETIAKHAQTVAAKAVADAQLANVLVGTRAETIAAKKAEMERAQADAARNLRPSSPELPARRSERYRYTSSIKCERSICCVSFRPFLVRNWCGVQ